MFSEEDAEPVAGAFVGAAIAPGVNVIPAVFMEGVPQQRATHDILHLAFAHARLQLVDHLLGKNVSLFDIDPIDERKLERAAAGKHQRKRRCNKEFQHFL